MMEKSVGAACRREAFPRGTWIVYITCAQYARKTNEVRDVEILRFDTTKKGGCFKILNATNGGPWHRRYINDQYRTNLQAYKAARIPYSRNHDSGVEGIYGGPFSHDITRIFPDFGADVDDPASYDFACTDESILTTLDAGTETFFRLGQTIEHQIKKHGTLPPPDFCKWAQICEHVIRHYNCGWADGFRLNIQYWEIWNEPDQDPDDCPNKRTWGGTKAQFFDLYEIAATHLKACFPQLKIGGPALTFDEQWAAEFLARMRQNNVPIDFFSWHLYCTEPRDMIAKAERLKALVVDHGYADAEMILDEWNYVKGWSDAFQYSVNTIHGVKGAAFTMACITAAQKCDALDMLMYYDTRPSVFCGAFDFYTYEPLKGYYPLFWYGMFYDMDAEIRCVSDPDNVYTLCGTDKNGKLLCVVTHYTDDDSAEPKNVRLDFGRDGRYEVYMVDKETSGERIGVTDDPTFTLPACSFILLREI